MIDFRIGQGYDVHQIREGLPMYLCGIRIPSDRGFVAHSDGDVAIHALCDALLGALALGDIGHLFPDTDPKYKGIDSSLLLAEVLKRVEGLGWELINADITIALQAPKLAPHIGAMRERLAEIIGVDISQISVKATTTERLGFVGRGEGCEVWAIVILGKK
ncbi:MAG: 2-C-methyl-D-erythritol 2,4-cyclodiphosphate synthase [Candidatus Cryptobacteroides sp.]